MSVNAAELLNFQSRLVLALHGIDGAALERPERDGAWSIANVIAHLGDIELLTAWRVRRILTEEEPELDRQSQNDWVQRLHGGERVAELLEDFWSLRRQNVALAGRLAPDALARTGIHPRAGRVDVPQLFALVHEHAERHLLQIERIKSTLGLQTTTGSNLAGVRAATARDCEFRSPGPGVRVYDLWQEGARRALRVEFEAGAQWPGLDYHVPGPEEVYVVSGDFDDGERVSYAGTFLHYPAGTSHSPVSRNGCVLFVYYPEG